MQHFYPEHGQAVERGRRREKAVSNASAESIENDFDVIARIIHSLSGHERSKHTLPKPKARWKKEREYSDVYAPLIPRTPSLLLSLTSDYDDNDDSHETRPAQRREPTLSSRCRWRCCESD